MSQTDKRSDDKRHDWWERDLCHKQTRDQMIKDVAVGKKDLCHKQTRDQMIKDMIGGKRIYVIKRQEIR